MDIVVYTEKQIAKFADEVSELQNLLAKETGPTHNFFYYTARMNERIAIIEKTNGYS